MRKQIYFFLITPLLFLAACNKPPEACMQISSNSVSVGQQVEFTSCSKKALSYEWFITGPAAAPENNLGWSDTYFTNTFSVTGTYTVTLTAYENFSFLGRTAIVEETIVVH